MANQKVGAVYEVGIDDVGYMLADSPQRPVHRQTGVLDAQPPGSDDPLSERIGRYDFVGQSDWTGGEGQKMADRSASDATRYYLSDLADPFNTPGQVTSTPAATTLLATTNNLSTDTHNPGIIGAGAKYYAQTGDSHLTDQAATAFATGLGASIKGMAYDGSYWYASDGTTIRRNNASADPAANWSVQAGIYELEWGDDRLYGVTAFTTPGVIYEFDTAGVATAITGAHPANSYVYSMTSGDGYVWYGGFSPGFHRGKIYFWQVDSSPTNAGVAFTLPSDEIPMGCHYYLGNVFVASGRVANVGGSPIIVETRIYRCVHGGDGTLQPQLVCEFTVQALRTWFTGAGKFVAFTTRRGANSAGIGIIDLETGGFTTSWARATITGATDGQPLGVITYDTGIAFRVDEPVGTGGGIWWIPDPDSSDYATTNKSTAVIETSISDLATPALKHLDEILVSTLPLPASTSVAVAYSIDGGANYTTAATFSTAGDTQHTIELATAVKASSFRLKLTLTPSTVNAPTVTGVLAKTHMTGIVDEIIELPINAEDYLADVNGSPLAEDSGPGKGIVRYRALQALVGTKVAYQDVDWKLTGETTLCEVIGVESTSIHVYNQNRGLSDVTAHVAVVTLRRPFTA